MGADLPGGRPETPATNDRRFMAAALEVAREAERLGEVPVGAVVVVADRVVGRGYNRREVDQDPLAHAELIALRDTCRALGRWRLTDATLYVTLEPCVMCAGALVQARLGRLVFGATDPKYGAVGSQFDLPRDARLNHRVAVTGGIEGEACRALLDAFFARLRHG
ncbi:MAG TPA: tRNA adenosine(34) deaminase TadA [bacterium]